MDHKEFKKILQKCTGKYGFHLSGKNHYFQSGNILIIINTQKSNYDDSYYINYGFCVKTLHPVLKYPRINECDIIGRFINTAADDKASLFRMSELDPDRLVHCLDWNLQNIIMPTAEGGIIQYFEMFPHAVHAAKENLKEYLKNGAVRCD